LEEIPVPIFLSIFSEVDLHFFNLEVLCIFFFVLLLIICSAFISGAEVAYFSLTASELDDLEKQKESSEIINLLKNPKSSFSNYFNR
tara:strand:- start:234 stop:494 length:261 start_codon:yes stop_codon:yes gene_type:complete